MSKPKNKFSYIMWALFTGLLSVLFYRSTLEFLNGIEALDKQYNIVIVVLLFVVVIELVILFDNLIKRGKEYEGDKRYAMYGVVGFTIALLSFLSIRLVTSVSTIAKINGSNVLDSLYDRALIGSDGRVFVSFDNVSDIYCTVLSCNFKLWGNCAAGVYGTEFLLGLIAFLLIYFAVKALYGRMEAFVCCMGMAIFPLFGIYVTDYADYLVEYLMFALGLFSVSIAKRCMRYKAGSYVAVCIVSLIAGLLMLYDNITVGLVFLLMCIVIEADELITVAKVVNCLLSILFFAIGFFGYTVYEAFASADPTRIASDIEAYCIYRFVKVFDYTVILEYAKINFVLIIFIACLSYSVMFLRCRFDEAHSAILVFLITAAAMCYLPVYSGLTYSVVCSLCLFIIAGAGIKKLVMTKINATIVEEMDEDILEEDISEEVAADMEIIDLTKEDIEEVSEEVEEDTEEDIEETTDEVVEESIVENKVELFINPLPMPKKGEKKEIKYDYDVADEDMHYDIELTDANDFYDVV